MYPATPIFDQDSTGIIMVGYKLPIQKLGLNFCLNKDSKLYYIQSPIFDKTKLSEKGDNYFRCLNSGEYMAVQPKFSKDFTRLLYVGSRA